MIMKCLQNSGTDLEKLKHELLGSLGIIKMLTSSLIQGSIATDKIQSILQLINTLAERNMQIITDLPRNEIPAQ